MKKLLIMAMLLAIVGLSACSSSKQTDITLKTSTAPTSSVQVDEKTVSSTPNSQASDNKTTSEKNNIQKIKITGNTNMVNLNIKLNGITEKNLKEAIKKASQNLNVDEIDDPSYLQIDSNVINRINVNNSEGKRNDILINAKHLYGANTGFYKSILILLINESGNEQNTENIKSLYDIKNTYSAYSIPLGENDFEITSLKADDFNGDKKDELAILQWGGSKGQRVSNYFKVFAFGNETIYNILDYSLFEGEAQAWVRWIDSFDFVKDPADKIQKAVVINYKESLGTVDESTDKRGTITFVLRNGQLVSEK